MADIAGIGFLALIAGSAAIGFGRKVLERRRARRTIRKQAPLVADSAEGETVRAVGIARAAEETLVAPISNRACLVVRSRVSANRGFAGLAARPKETIAMVPFLLDRGEEGIVRIEGQHVLLDLPPLKMTPTDIDTTREQLFMTTHELPLRDHGNATFEETIVQVGDRITVAGLVMKDVAGDAAVDAERERGFRDEMPTTLRIAGNAAHPLAIGLPVDE